MSKWQVRIPTRNTFDLGEITYEKIDQLEELFKVDPCSLYGPTMPLHVKMRAQLVCEYHVPDDCPGKIVERTKDYTYMASDHKWHPDHLIAFGLFSPLHIQLRLVDKPELAMAKIDAAHARLKANFTHGRKLEY